MVFSPSYYQAEKIQLLVLCIKNAKTVVKGSGNAEGEQVVNWWINASCVLHN